LKNCEHKNFTIINELFYLFLINVMYTCISQDNAEH
jgi:hypothetical protein